MSVLSGPNSDLKTTEGPRQTTKETRRYVICQDLSWLDLYVMPVKTCGSVPTVTVSKSSEQPGEPVEYLRRWMRCSSRYHRQQATAHRRVLIVDSLEDLSTRECRSDWQQ